MPKKPLKIRPDSIYEGAQIVVEVPADLSANVLTVSPSPELNLEQFEVPIKNFSQARLAQFTIDIAGSYTLSVSDIKQTIQVDPHQELSFQAEFGLTAILVSIFFLGAVIWTIKRKKRSETP